MKWWWLSCNRFTIAVAEGEGRKITVAPPIAQGFVGQPIGNLSRWMMRIGGFKYARLEAGGLRAPFFCPISAKI